MDRKYYNLKEIEKIFERFKQGPETQTTEEEYKVFCCAIKELPRELIDRTNNEIYFIFLSAEIQRNTKLGCYINLKQAALKDKNGLIVLSPYILGNPYADKRGKITMFYTMEHHTILHELAHHFLGHADYKDEQDKKRGEREARKKVRQWRRNFQDFLSGLTPKDVEAYE